MFSFVSETVISIEPDNQPDYDFQYEIDCLKQDINNLENTLKASVEPLIELQDLSDDGKFDSPVEVLIRAKNKELLKSVLDGRKNKTQKSPFWESAFREAILSHDEEIFDMVVEHVDLETFNYASNDEDSIWKLLTEEANTSIISKLMELGLSIDIPCRRQFNALFYAAYNKRLDVLKLLIEDYRGMRYIDNFDRADNTILEIARQVDNNEQVIEYVKCKLDEFYN